MNAFVSLPCVVSEGLKTVFEDANAPESSLLYIKVEIGNEDSTWNVVRVFFILLV